MIEEQYQEPYKVYKYYFPNGNEEEFNKSFVTFGLDKKEFEELVETNFNHKTEESSYVLLEGVCFDLKYIKSKIRSKKY